MQAAGRSKAQAARAAHHVLDDVIDLGATVSDGRHLLVSLGRCGATGALHEPVPGAARFVEGLALPTALRRGCCAGVPVCFWLAESKSYSAQLTAYCALALIQNAECRLWHFELITLPKGPGFGTPNPRIRHSESESSSY